MFILVYIHTTITVINNYWYNIMITLINTSSREQSQLWYPSFTSLTSTKKHETINNTILKSQTNIDKDGSVLVPSDGSCICVTPGICLRMLKDYNIRSLGGGIQIFSSSLNFIWRIQWSHAVRYTATWDWNKTLYFWIQREKIYFPFIVRYFIVDKVSIIKK